MTYCFFFFFLLKRCYIYITNKISIFAFSTVLSVKFFSFCPSLFADQISWDDCLTRTGAQKCEEIFKRDLSACKLTQANCEIKTVKVKDINHREPINKEIVHCTAESDSCQKQCSGPVKQYLSAFEVELTGCCPEGYAIVKSLSPKSDSRVEGSPSACVNLNKVGHWIHWSCNDQKKSPDHCSKLALKQFTSVGCEVNNPECDYFAAFLKGEKSDSKAGSDAALKERQNYANNYRFQCQAFSSNCQVLMKKCEKGDYLLEYSAQDDEFTSAIKREEGESYDDYVARTRKRKAVKIGDCAPGGEKCPAGTQARNVGDPVGTICVSPSLNTPQKDATGSSEQAK